MSNSLDPIYSLLAQNTLDIIYFARAKDRQIIGVNQAAIKTYGYTIEEFLGLRIEDLEAHDSLFPQIHRMTRHDETGVVFETIHCRKDKSEFPIEISLEKADHGEGQVFVCIGRDITIRKKTEEEKSYALANSEKQIRRLTALNDIDKTITSDFNLPIVLNMLLEQVMEQLHVDAADLRLINFNTLVMEYAAGRGFRSANVTGMRQRVGDGLAGQAVMERRLVIVSDLASNEEFLHSDLLAGDKFVTYYGAPLIAKGQVVGILEIFERKPRPRDQEWESFLGTLASQAAMAISTSRMLENLHRSNLETSIAIDLIVEGWSRGLDMRIAENEGHTQRVTEISINLANMMDIGEHNLVHIKRGALLHDIGKMGISDQVLNKASELTPQEWNIMRMHPGYAYDLIYPIKYLRPALDIPYCHHERWDGTGYPRGLKRETIPIAARIFSIVDVWDSLRSDRPYRNRWGADVVQDYIREQSGRLFDPSIVDMFIEMIKPQKKHSPADKKNNSNERSIHG